MPLNTSRAALAPDPLQVMRRVVTEAMTLIPAAEGAVVELVSEDVLTYVCAAGSLAGTEGVQVRTVGSLSGTCIAAGHALRCDDAMTDARVDREACLRVGVVSMIVLPLPYRAGIAGVLKLSSSRAGAFDETDVRVIAGLARFIGEAIGGWAELANSALHAIDTTPEQAAADDGRDGGKVSAFLHHVLAPHADADGEARSRISSRLRLRNLQIVLQPIVHLTSSSVAGYESLSRFEGDPTRPPDEWFAEAEGVGLGPELELLAVEMALARLADLPDGAYLAINVGYGVIVDPRLRDRLTMVDPSRIVLELTEHLAVPDYPALNLALDRLRDLGVRLAIDDTGAGFASFSHILRLSPDILKLDRILTAGIDRDPARQALAGALVNFAGATRAQVVAEGIETAAELRTVRALGVEFGQGYLIARPHPDPVVPPPPAA